MLQPPRFTRVRIAPGDGASGQADRCRVRRDVLQDDRPGANAGSLANRDRAQDRGADAKDGIRLDRRVAFTTLLARTAEGDTLVHGHVVADGGSLTDDDAHAMVDEDPFADSGAGMNLDAGDEPAELRQEAGRKEQSFLPQ